MDGQFRDGRRRDRYALLAHHRRVEKRVEAIGRRWEEFRNVPTPTRLAALRRSVVAADRALGRLTEALEGEARRSAGATEQPSGGLPTPRDLVDAGRELDTVIHGAFRTWTAARSEPDGETLRRVSDMLAQAERSAETLASALGAMEGAGGRPAEPGASAPIGAVGTLDGLLAELHREWMVLRRRPAAEGTARLRGLIGESRRQAAALAGLAASGSPLASSEALSYLAGAAERVRFGPYRDSDTGSYNGRGFGVSAAAELDRCARYERPFGVILLALAGEDEGSARPVIGAIRSLLRDTDLVGRLSDGELVLALPESDGRATRRIAARILRALDATGRGAAVRRLAYAVAPEEGRTLEQLLRSARTRLEF